MGENKHTGLLASHLGKSRKTYTTRNHSPTALLLLFLTYGPTPNLEKGDPIGYVSKQGGNETSVSLRRPMNQPQPGK